MLVYIILAEICLTVGAPNWAVVLCWVGLGVVCVRMLIEIIQKIIKIVLDRED